MRLLTIILSIYFLLLTAVPCCAFDSCADDDVTTEQQGQPHNDEDKGCNNCSPFFSCHSCSGFVVADVILVQEEAEPVHTKQVFSTTVPHYTPNYIPSSWQPPRA